MLIAMFGRLVLDNMQEIRLLSQTQWTQNDPERKD